MWEWHATRSPAPNQGVDDARMLAGSRNRRPARLRERCLPQQRHPTKSLNQLVRSRTFSSWATVNSLSGPKLQSWLGKTSMFNVQASITCQPLEVKNRIT